MDEILKNLLIGKYIVFKNVLRQYTYTGKIIKIEDINGPFNNKSGYYRMIGTENNWCRYITKDDNLDTIISNDGTINIFDNEDDAKLFYELKKGNF